MNAPKPPLPVRAAEGWATLYTRGLPSEIRDARRAELRSDLWEHLQHASSNGDSQLRWSIQVLGRVARGMTADLWWRFEQGGASRPQTVASAGRRRLLAWLLDWVVTPVVAIGVLLSTWFSASPLRLGGALAGLFLVLAVLRMKLVGAASNASALIFGAVPADADPGRIRRLWLGLITSVLLLVAVTTYVSRPNSWQGPVATVAGLLRSLLIIGMISSIVLLVTEYTRKWRRGRREL